MAPDRQVERLVEEGARLWSLERYGAAVEQVTAALRLAPQDAGILELRGAILLDWNQPRRALTDFEAAIRLSPYSDTAYWGKGRAFLALGDPAWAITQLSQAISLNPDIPEYHTDLEKARHLVGM